MKNREKLIQEFIDDVNNHDFICGSLFNMDKEQTLAARVKTEDEKPIFEIDFQHNNRIEVFDYYSKFRVDNPGKNKWLLRRVATLMNDLEEA